MEQSQETYPWPAAFTRPGRRQFVYGRDGEICRWVAERIPHVTKMRGEEIGIAQNGELIVGVVYNNYSTTDICMHVAAAPGKLWATREALSVFFHYPFRKLACRRVTALVAFSNRPCRSFTESLGWKPEGIMRDAIEDGDDLIVYGMLKSECRWLEGTR